MTQQHPFPPPSELVRQWAKWKAGDMDPEDLWFRIAHGAAQWGADQELEACCEWMDYNCPSVGAHHLRATRRPKPPSLKEQALDVLKDLANGIETTDSWAVIQSALEQLDD